MGTYRDMTGYRCGALRAVREVGKDKHGHSLWECVCEKCGRKKVVNYVALVAGKMKDCGCTPARGYDLTGETYGTMTVVKPVGLNASRERVWQVRCEVCRKKSTRTVKQLMRTEHPACPICGAVKL